MFRACVAHMANTVGVMQRFGVAEAESPGMRASPLSPAGIGDSRLGARRAGEQFAEDSGGEEGAIKRANQGYFSIKDLESYTLDTSAW